MFECGNVATRQCTVVSRPASVACAWPKTGLHRAGTPFQLHEPVALVAAHVTTPLGIPPDHRIRAAKPVLGDQPVIHAPRGMPLLAWHTPVRLEPRVDHLCIRVDTRRARRTRGRLRRAILHPRILPDGLPRHTQAARYPAPRHALRVKEPGILPYRHRFRRSFPSRKPLEPAIRENTEVHTGPVPSSHRK